MHPEGGALWGPALVTDLKGRMEVPGGPWGTAHLLGEQVLGAEINLQNRRMPGGVEPRE